MDHAYIEEHQVADRYVMGTLAPAEAERFEDHYLACPECLERLHLAEALQQGFRRMARQDAEALSAARQLAIVAWLARLGGRRQAAVLSAAFLFLAFLAILPAGLALRGLASRERDLAQARSALQSERERSAASARSAGEVAAALRTQLDASRRDLAGERAARARAVEQLAQANQPQANVPILFFDAERGAGPPAGEPTQRLRRPAPGGWIVLDVTIAAPVLQSYRAVLEDAHGRELWRSTSLRPDDRDTLALSLPESLVPPGDYSLSIEGLVTGGKPIAAGRFTFRVLPPA